jgi:hypothetical protein
MTRNRVEVPQEKNPIKERRTRKNIIKTGTLGVGVGGEEA